MIGIMSYLHFIGDAPLWDSCLRSQQQQFEAFTPHYGVSEVNFFSGRQSLQSANKRLFDTSCLFINPQQQVGLTRTLPYEPKGAVFVQ